MTEPIAYLKGEFVPASQCVLPIYDLGIVLGAAVTDFFPTFHQSPYRLDDHLQRFYRSCRYARITPPVSLEESRKNLREADRRKQPTGSWPGTGLGVLYDRG